MSRDGNVPAAVITAAVSLGMPPVLVTALEVWPQVVDNPIASGALGLAGSAALYAVGHVAQLLWQRLVHRPVIRVADALAGAVAAPRQRRRFLSQVRREAVRQPDRRGEAAHVFAPLLDAIYVDVSVDRGWARKHGTTLEANWPDDRPGRPNRAARRVRAGERASLNQFIKLAKSSGNNTLLVTGQPGAGKSAQLRHSALWACDGGIGLIPVPLRLRDHAPVIRDRGEETSLLDLVFDTPIGHRVSRDWLRRQLVRGNCLIMLDGLDEVGGPEIRGRVARWIHTELSRNPNVLVVTSRPEGFIGTVLEEHGVPLNVRAFTVKQTMEFLTNWYRALEAGNRDGTTGQIIMHAERKAHELITQFRRSPALYDLASRPLLLAMIASVHYNHGKLPASRTEVYHQMCEMLLWRQDIAEDVSPTLNQRQRRLVIRRFALAMMTMDREVLTESEAVEVVAGAMQRMHRPMRPQRFLKSMVYEGLLVVGLHGAYEFPHTTVKEYLAAACLIDNRTAPTEYVEDRRWHEVIKMWCAMVEPSEVVAACLESKDPETLWLAFECARESDELDHAQRERLNELRATGDVPTLIHIYDNLDATLKIGEGSTVCARPVSETLRHEFQLELSADRKYLPPPDISMLPPQTRKPARGMWPTDVAWFLEWVNDHTDDDTNYRLPTQEELEDPAVTISVDVSRTPVWTADEDGLVRLYCRDSVAHSFGDTDWLLRENLTRDRQTTSGHLVLALAFLRSVTMNGEDDSAFAASADGAVQFSQRWGFATTYDEQRRREVALEEARASGDDDAITAELDRYREFTERGELDRVLSRILKFNLSKFRLLDAFPQLDPDIDLDELLHKLGDTQLARYFTQHQILDGRLSTVDHLLIRSHLLLLEAWLREVRDTNVTDPVRHFDEFLITAARGDVGDVVVFPEEVLAALDRAAEAVEQLAERSDVRLPGDVGWVLRRTREMIAPVLERIMPHQPHYLAYVRLALAAACLACRELSAEDAMTYCRRALCGIDVLAGRSTNSIVPTEVLLLARD